MSRGYYKGRDRGTTGAYMQRGEKGDSDSGRYREWKGNHQSSRFSQRNSKSRNNSNGGGDGYGLNKKRGPGAGGAGRKKNVGAGGAGEGMGAETSPVDVAYRRLPSTREWIQSKGYDVPHTGIWGVLDDVPANSLARVRKREDNPCWKFLGAREKKIYAGFEVVGYLSQKKGKRAISTELLNLKKKRVEENFVYYDNTPARGELCPEDLMTAGYNRLHNAETKVICPESKTRGSAVRVQHTYGPERVVYVNPGETFVSYVDNMHQGNEHYNMALLTSNDFSCGQGLPGWRATGKLCSQEEDGTEEVSVMCPVGHNGYHSYRMNACRFFAVEERTLLKSPFRNIFCIPLSPHITAAARARKGDNTEGEGFVRGQKSSVCYLIETPSVNGNKKGKMLDPILYTVLKGHCVYNKERGEMWTPDDVSGECKKGYSSLFVDCQNNKEVDTLKADEFLRTYQKRKKRLYFYGSPSAVFDDICFEEKPVLKMIYHYTPLEVMRSDEYVEWMNSFGSQVNHVILNGALAYGGFKSNLEAVLYTLYGKLGPDFFPFPVQTVPASFTPSELKAELGMNGNLLDSTTAGRYTEFNFKDENRSLVDRSKPLPNTAKERNEFFSSALAYLGRFFSGSFLTTDSSGIANQIVKEEHAVYDPMVDMEPTDMIKASRITPRYDFSAVTILGTAATKPEVGRSLSSTVVRYEKDKYVMFDCGEGTYHRLGQRFGENLDHVLAKLTSIVISHEHLDHHLGLYSVLKKRYEAICRLREKGEALDIPDSIYIVGSALIGKLVNDYKQEHAMGLQDVEMIMYGRQQLSVIDIAGYRLNALLSKHTYWARSCVFEFPSGFALAHSADTRARKDFAEMAERLNTDIFIHEATYPSDKADTAFANKHSTTYNALSMGNISGAPVVALTHFGSVSSVFRRVSEIRSFLKHVRERGCSNQAFVAAEDMMTLVPPDALGVQRYQDQWNNFDQRLFAVQGFALTHLVENYEHGLAGKMGFSAQVIGYFEQVRSKVHQWIRDNNNQIPDSFEADLAALCKSILSTHQGNAPIYFLRQHIKGFGTYCAGQFAAGKQPEYFNSTPLSLPRK
eukprot:Nk52_evm18s233 gene=Nk52_evmTU18s233